MVTAYFIDDNGDYYEERLTTSPIGPIQIEDSEEELQALFSELETTAREAGEPAHYRDTCTTLYLHTQEMEANLADDEWIKKQAKKKAELVLQHEPKEVA